MLTVSEIILHPDYNWDSSANDIALVMIIIINITTRIIITIIIIIIKNPKVKLESDVDLNTYSPACLPEQASSTLSS